MKKTSWGNVAEWYDESLEKGEDTYQRKVILPNILRIFGLNEKGKGGNGMPQTILDLACGQGFFSREIAKADSTVKVVASDISPELIGLARNNPDPISKKIDYHVSPAGDISFIKNEGVDHILISLAIQNIEDIASVFSECARVLKKGSSSSLLLVLNHPSFRIPKRTSWQWNETDSAEAIMYRRVDGYMSESKTEIDMNPGSQQKEHTISFHRPLQIYVKALAKSGFAISRLEEWISHKESQPGPRAEEENRMRKEIPMFMAIEANIRR